MSHASWREQDTPCCVLRSVAATRMTSRQACRTSLQCCGNRTRPTFLGEVTAEEIAALGVAAALPVLGGTDPFGETPKVDGDPVLACGSERPNAPIDVLALV